MYCIGAGSEADAVTTMVCSIAPYSVSVWTTWRGGPVKTSRAQVAWTGKNQRIELNPEAYAYLFERAWVNPHPDKAIDTIGQHAATVIAAIQAAGGGGSDSSAGPRHGGRQPE